MPVTVDDAALARGLDELSAALSDDVGDGELLEVALAAIRRTVTVEDAYLGAPPTASGGPGDGGETGAPGGAAGGYGMSFPLVVAGATRAVVHLRRAEPLTSAEQRAVATLTTVTARFLALSAHRRAASAAQEDLAYRAMHDPLTGLPVRWVFLEHLDRALARLARRPGHVGLLFCDLDGLKYVNDTYGHLAGDQLLRTCAERARAALRPSDVLARIGGDEFVVLLEEIGGTADASAVAARIAEHLAEPYPVGTGWVTPSASIGVATTEEPSTGGDTLIAHADAAMYRAKQGGRGRVEVFDATAYAEDRAGVTAREDLLRALADGQFAVHFQPIIDLTDPAGEGGVWAVEALVRWHHRQRGLLSAEAFIAAAERSGALVELGAWVLATACEQFARWRCTTPTTAPKRLFVNASVVELAQQGFVGRVRAALQAAGLEPGCLTLEITETGLLSEPRGVAETIAGLRRLGCELALDDFGTGYSSLGRLTQIPASVIKIDQSLTRGLAVSADAAAVLSAVLLLGHNLRRTVIVEGVESADDLDRLAELGATHVQGYHLARPAPAESLAGLRRDPYGDPAGRITRR